MEGRPFTINGHPFAVAVENRIVSAKYGVLQHDYELAVCEEQIEVQHEVALP